MERPLNGLNPKNVAVPNISMFSNVTSARVVPPRTINPFVISRFWIWDAPNTLNLNVSSGSSPIPSLSTVKLNSFGSLLINPNCLHSPVL